MSHTKDHPMLTVVEPFDGKSLEEAVDEDGFTWREVFLESGTLDPDDTCECCGQSFRRGWVTQVDYADTRCNDCCTVRRKDVPR